MYSYHSDTGCARSFCKYLRYTSIEGKELLSRIVDIHCGNVVELVVVLYSQGSLGTKIAKNGPFIGARDLSV